MEERPRTPSVVSLSLTACAGLSGISAVQTQGLAAPDKADRFSPRLTALSTTFTPVGSGKCLYTYLCRAFFLASLPARFPLCPKPSPFSGPTTARASGTAAALSYLALL